jgi:DNA-directed RNA polymerase subunit RPC12/RpoP
MRCIKCDTDNNLKDRTANQGRCTNCGHPFVFDPMVMEKPLTFTDRFFEKAIFDLSANGTLFFTPKQFYYLLERRLKQRADKFPYLGGWGIYLFIVIWLYGTFQDDIAGLIFISSIFNLILLLFFVWQSSDRTTFYPNRLKATTNLMILGCLIILGGVLSINLTGYFYFILSILVGLLPIYLGQRQRAKIKNNSEILVNQEKFTAWLNQWTRVNQAITELLPSPQAESQPSTINPDIGNYSFDRLVVCDNSSIAQMLIANNFHFEHSCAILSVTGYPQRIFNPVMEMLRRNPDLKVYAFHNASPKGVGLVHHLQTSAIRSLKV